MKPGLDTRRLQQPGRKTRVVRSYIANLMKQTPAGHHHGGIFADAKQRDVKKEQEKGRTSDVNDAGVGALRWGFADLEAYCMIGRGLFLPARLHVSIAIFSCVVACEPELFPGAAESSIV